ncbi:MAG TPA: trehalose-6-phosphate synthase [Clostridia bacterium]|nr:trehalose-6-phosphate synthase [Clostridia bacterium]
MRDTSRLIVVSNRLPVTVSCSGDLRPSSGGLVTALGPLLKTIPSTWIGWTGTDYAPGIDSQLNAMDHHQRKLVPVYLTEYEKEKFYLGFANQVLWPLFHNMQTLCNFDASYWDAYQAVTEKFADAVTASAMPDDLVWVHDYHLMLLGRSLRRRRLGLRLAYFHHVPFPGPDTFATLPTGETILRAMLSFERIGFQTSGDRHNFLQCLRNAFGRRLRLLRRREELVVQFEGTSTSLLTSPIGIDSQKFATLAGSSEVAVQMQSLDSAFRGSRMMLGVDRLDYTKGVPQRLSAYKMLLEQHPELQGELVLLQLIIPSREEVPEYESLRLSVERQISEINGTFGRPRWTPIVYMHRSIPCEELVALYRSATAMLVTSLKDGMNLVAKEFCASKVDQSGVLVLSKFAGASQELCNGAVLVNPHDIAGLAQSFFTALTMSRSEVRTRMAAMQKAVMHNDIWHWCSSALGNNVGGRSRNFTPRAALASTVAVA